MHNIGRLRSDGSTATLCNEMWNSDGDGCTQARIETSAWRASCAAFECGSVGLGEVSRENGD